jgi:hypothetical protein
LISKFFENQILQIRRVKPAPVKAFGGIENENFLAISAPQAKIPVSQNARQTLF